MPPLDMDVSVFCASLVMTLLTGFDSAFTFCGKNRRF